MLQELDVSGAVVGSWDIATLLGTNVRISPTDRLQTLLATLEISSASQLKRILARVKGLPSVSDARRIL